ncbi:MAG: TonB family protein [Bradymonadia bacterium]
MSYVQIPSKSEMKPMSLPARQAVTLLTEREVRQMLSRKSPQRPKPPKKKEPEKPEEKKIDLAKGQVVEIPPPVREEVPENTNLVSDYDSKVEKQMIANTNKPPSQKMIKGPEVKVSPGDDPDGNTRERKRPAKRSKRKSKRRKGPQRKDDGIARQNPSEKVGQQSNTKTKSAKWQEEVPGVKDMAKVADGSLQSEQERQRANTQGGNGPMASAGAPEDYRSLLPTMGLTEQEASVGSVDRVEDVADGPQTLLNTRSSKYAWFFNRVKNQVVQHWRPGQAYRRRDPYGRVYGRKDRVTVVEVTLNPKGGLEDIYIKKDSGVAFLDEVVIQAFQKAQPFPNPPAGLKGDDGMITFSFVFYLELNRPGMRFFR